MVELQILGHLILFAICLLITMVYFSRDENIDSPFELLPFALVLFVPLEIIYLGLHWYFVGF